MKKIIGVVVVFIIAVIAFHQGASYFSRRAGEKRERPVVITGSYSGDNSPKAEAEQYHTIEWEELVPAGWNPVKSTEGLKIEDLNDSDPRAVEALKKTMDAWKNAPVNPALNGRSVRIAGFVVPLEYQGNALKEFLLVPYYGACIHTPPPPPNQIILVSLAKPARNIRAMDAVWITGDMTVEQKSTVLGVSGYAMKGLTISPYVEEKTPEVKKEKES
jgi:hypothetical protein